MSVPALEMAEEWTGKTVVVTGGASGIGLAMAKLLAAYSTNIALLDISADQAEVVISGLKTDYPSSTFMFQKCDVSSWDEQKMAFEHVHEEFGSVDIVFANAGVGEIGKFLEPELEPTKPTLRSVDINLVGTLYTLKLAVYYMRKNTSARKGSIICTASNAGLYPFPVGPMYGVSKHGVVGAIRSFAKPLESEGIQINGICPNCIKTGLADDRLFSAMHPTPMSTAINAVQYFLTNPKLTGCTAEVSGENVTFQEPPEYVDEITKLNFGAFWALGYA